eukprot:6719092-Prymnesium_polylepis.1
MRNLPISRCSLEFDDVSVAPTRWTAGGEAVMGAAATLSGPAAGVRPRLTAGGGASQLPTWLARPRHQGGCAPPP